MGRYLARIIRAVVVAMLGAGGGVGLMTFIGFVIYSDHHTAVEMGLITAVVVGLGFGAIIAGVFLLTDLTMRLFAAQGKYDEIWELEQSRELQLEGSLNDVRRVCREALMSVPNLKSVSEGDSELLLSASIGRSWRSPGEDMKVTIAPLSDGRWKLQCQSKCIQENISFDYAKNYENVESWLRKLRSLAADGLA